MRLRELTLFYFMEAISTSVLVFGSHIYCDLFSPRAMRDCSYYDVEEAYGGSLMFTQVQERLR